MSNREAMTWANSEPDIGYRRLSLFGAAMRSGAALLRALELILARCPDRPFKEPVTGELKCVNKIIIMQTRKEIGNERY